jgi:hypothetical protein
MSKKILLGVIALLTVAGIITYNVDMQAFSGCHISGNPDKNTGYCVRKYQSNSDVCVFQADSDAVRCNGN